MLTEDGYESTFQVNYLSHFSLTGLLIDELRKSEQGRNINLSSSVYTLGQFDIGDLQGEKRFSTMAAYSTSKLLMLMFTIELAERLGQSRVTTNALHPGIVRTQMMWSAPGIFRLLAYFAVPFSVSPQGGAATSVYLASSPDVKGISGKYFTNSKVAYVKSKFNTKKNRALLWDESPKCLQQAGTAA
jgi:NAD(P)-dependent dehydrogenase (short-subunit alcohol dehydrogenase family)